LLKKLLVLILLTANGAIASVGAQSSAQNALDLRGIDQGLPYPPKFEEFGVTLTGRAPTKQLELGESLERDLRGGESDVYGLNLAEGQFVRLDVEQRGIHASVTLFGPVKFGPDKMGLLKMNAPNGRAGVQTLGWVANLSGQYAVEIASNDPHDPPGRYQIRILALRKGEPADRKFVSALRVYATGLDVCQRMNEEAQANALVMLEESQKRWQELGEAELREQARRFMAMTKRNLGVIYEGGHGVPRNEERKTKYFREATEDWYRTAAERGDADAETVLGDAYAFGRGVPQDAVQAADWYRRAADQGNPRAENNVGYLYTAGLGLKQDFTEAIQWFRRAAEQGNAVAKRNLGILYRNGRGVSKDPAAASEWFKKAAEQGDAEARRLLAP